MKEFQYKINGKEYSVQIQKLEEQEAVVAVNGTEYTVQLPEVKKPVAARPVIKRVAPVAAATVAAAPASQTTSVAGGIKAPLPGVIIELSVKEGDTVTRGQKVAVLEAMKMENNILSDRDGKVVEIKVQKGDSILEGHDIVVIG